MTDEAQQDQPPKEEGVKPSELAAATNFADYEALRVRQSVPEKDESTDVSPDKPDDTTSAASESADDDGEEDAGKKASSEQDRDDLPKGVKKRLDRAKRQRELARREADEWRRKYEQAVASSTKPPDDDAGAGKQEQQAGADEPVPEGQDYNFDYPEESDYMADENDAEGLSAYLEDVDRFENRLPLKGGKHAATQGNDDADPDKGTQRRENRQQDTPPDDADARAQHIQGQINQMFSDINETLDDASGDDEDVAQDFMDQVRNQRIKLSMDMLEWMADHDEETVAVARKFLETPRIANRIFRAAPGRQAQMLTDLAKPKQDTSRGKDNARGKTVVRDLNASRTTNPSGKLLKAGSFAEYERLRNSMTR